MMELEIGVTIHVLLLNGVRVPAEEQTPIAAFTSREKGEAWEQAQRAEAVYMHDPGVPDSYGRVHPYQLTYKQGSLAVWFNPPDQYVGGFVEVFVKETELDDWLWNHDIRLDPD